MSVLNPKSQSELNDALALCKGGEEIELAAPLTAGGLFGIGAAFTAPVRITGRFISDPAGAAAKQPYWPALMLQDCANLTFTDSDFEGQIVSEFERYGRGLYIERGRNITVEKSRLGKAYQGGLFNNVAGFVLSLNVFDELAGFGFQAACLRDAQILQNLITGFHIYFDPTLDANLSEHADAGQFMCVPGYEQGCENVLLRGNCIAADPDNRPQGWFFQDLAGVGLANGTPHKNIRIEDELIVGTMFDALALDVAGSGLALKNIRVVPTTGGRLAPTIPAGGQVIDHSRIHIVRAPGFTIEGCEASFLLVDPTPGATPSAGLKQVQPVSPDVAGQLVAAWKAALDPTPSPAPVPAPTPSPAPPPPPSDPVLAKLAKAQLEIDSTRKAADRATTAIEAAVRERSRQLNHL